MARKSIIKPLREFLQEAVIAAQKEQEAAARTERFRDAETYKSFKEVLLRAIELCGEEKSKEAADENRTN